MPLLREPHRYCSVFPQPPREAGLHETSDTEREMDGRGLKLQSQQMAELRSGPNVRVLNPDGSNVSSS